MKKPNAVCPKCKRKYVCESADKIENLNCGDCLMEHAEIVKLRPIKKKLTPDPMSTDWR